MQFDGDLDAPTLPDPDVTSIDTEHDGNVTSVEAVNDPRRERQRLEVKWQRTP